MAGDRNKFDDFFDDDTDETFVDTKAEGRLLRVPLNRISPNGVNPRDDFGTAEELQDFGRSLKRRQLQALPVVTRRAYLKLWPDHEQQVGNVDVVIVSGERRFRGATAVGMTALECVINDDLAESQQTFLDAVVTENVDRENFDAIEEAKAIEALVAAFGTATAVAEHFTRASGWVSQRRILLRLAPEVQELVRNRTMPLEPARTLGKLVKDNGWTSEQQLEWWSQYQLDRQTATAQRKAVRAEDKKAPESAPAPSADSTNSKMPAQQTPAAPLEAAPDSPHVFTAVKTSPAPSAVEEERAESASRVDGGGAVNPAVTKPASSSVPDQREQTDAVSVAADWAAHVPWEAPEDVSRVIAAHMKPQQRRTLIRILLELNDQEKQTTH